MNNSFKSHRKSMHSCMTHWLFVVIGSAFLFSGPAFAGWDFTTIAYPGAATTDVGSIDNSGRVVGAGQFADADGNLVAPYSVSFVYDARKKSFTALPPGAVGNVTAAFAGNDAGVIVGSAGPLDSGHVDRFIFDKGTY